ncbi:MAG: GNAT family N-acetyltransferase [Marivibrio sp.]|uniref:GNAT family N-acetyltransferase n=1 Tax=Marivibrio sp. TaxID=2039719 RepID=UPI0032EBD646
MTAAAPAPADRLTLSAVGVESFHVIAALYAEAFDEPWSEPSVRELMSAPGVWGLVAAEPVKAEDAAGASAARETGGDPVGFVLARVVAREAEVLAIGVRPCARRRGVARRLMRAALRLAAPHADAFFLEAGRDNPAATALYLSLGFREVGLRRDYYRRADGARVDAAIMRCDLGSEYSD